jgi:hypothetical protein
MIKPRLGVRVAAAFLIATLTGSRLSAADVRCVVARGVAAISITGEIAAGDADAFRSAIAQATAAGYPVSEIRLNSIGGNVFEGVKIVQLVNSANLNTSVAWGATCASVCFLAFAAGVEKSVDASSRIGVHVASGEFGEETSASIAATGALARIAQTLFVPTDIINRMVSTPATAMFWLGKSDLAEMGVTVNDGRWLFASMPLPV